ncbi:uncharacterized protein CC84DRAFT_497421 [Paraphaeosphaeria sporulosa]|uniref:Uncharacterized protein n=1 Tax=Paraphaeosphaeria sporulosa TaxID=1460663 RepID=A0A177CTN8_9PLEO|nr:uncharacterized protein CC84DRAFT_497421 [Paraphaeosphaeria sporulosa]OAG10905.1 hypothetical protein CC84DRAFT_497421 [Paraphaeosphaeria sporulosa]
MALASVMAARGPSYNDTSPLCLVVVLSQGQSQGCKILMFSGRFQVSCGRLKHLHSSLHVCKLQSRKVRLSSGSTLCGKLNTRENAL